MLPLGSILSLLIAGFFDLAAPESDTVFCGLPLPVLTLPGLAESVEIDDLGQVSPRGNVTRAGKSNLAPHSLER